MNDSKSPLKMVVTLGLVTLAAALSLGFVYKLTEEPIAAAQLKEKLDAIAEVIPQFNNEPLQSVYLIPGLPGEDSLEVYSGFLEEELVGLAVKTYTLKGYSGKIDVMVGFDEDGKVSGTKVLQHKETPGLGSKLSSQVYARQYVGLDPQQVDISVTKDGGTIDAISGATISSRAFSEAIQLASDELNKPRSHER